MEGTRRNFLKAAVTAAGAAATPNLSDVPAGAQTHGDAHQAVPSDLTLRVKSLESLLVEKGLVDPAALDALVDTFENKVGPRNGARVVARAWVDAGYKRHRPRPVLGILIPRRRLLNTVQPRIFADS